MFIGIVSKLSRTKGEPSMIYFDASRIIRVAANPASDDESGCLFWFHDADVGGALPYETPSYDCAGLIELVMQARLRPLEFLPSLYVGKRAATDDNDNNVTWSAPGRANGKADKA